MAEYIDRALAKEEVKHIPWCDWEAVGESLDSIPAADVEVVVHGRWKYYHKQNKAVCMECSFERDLNADFGKAIACPNCGAKMDLEVQ